jgi:hypothetical protein
MIKLTNLGTEEYPSNVAKEESFQSDVDEATFIDTPQGYYIPPGCTNGFYYRVSDFYSSASISAKTSCHIEILAAYKQAEYGGKMVNAKVCYNSKRVSATETPA